MKKKKGMLIDINEKRQEKMREKVKVILDTALEVPKILLNGNHQAIKKWRETE